MTARELVDALGGQGRNARCPAHDDRDPSLSVDDRPGGGLLVKCHAGCSQEDVLDALRERGLWPEPPEAAVETSWTCIDPITNETRVHHRKDEPGKDKRLWWSKGGPRPRRLLYKARVTGEGPLVVTEGETAADGAARLGLDAIGTVTGAAHVPDADVLVCFAKGRDLLLWPDHDPQGQKHMARIAALPLKAASVSIINPELLGLTGKGADAADFRPSDSVDVLAAVLEAAEHEKPNGRAGGDRAVPRDGDRDGDRDGVSPPHRIWRAWDALEGESGPPETVLPGLAWRGEFTLLVGDSKAGKTTLIAHALGAALRGESFLGQVPNLGGRIAYMSEMTPQRTKGWIAAHGVAWADVDFLPPVGFVQLVEYLGERNPALLIVDTLIAFGTAARSDENSANDMRALANVLLGSGTTCLASHHSMKHDPNTYRGSGDVRAAVGMAITMTGVDGGAPTDRQLRYLGRWNVGDDDRLVLRFNRETKTYHADAADDTTGRIVHAVRSEEGCTRYQALKLAGLPKGGRGYAAINAAIADALLVVGNQGELFTADAWRSMQGEQREAAR